MTPGPTGSEALANPTRLKRPFPRKCPHLIVSTPLGTYWCIRLASILRMGSFGLPKRVIKSCFWKEAICARLFSLLPRVSVKNRRAEFPPTDDASLCKDSERKASEVLKRSLKALADDQLGTFVDHVLAVLTEQLGGLASSLWLLDGDKRHFCLHSICEGGRVVAAEESGHPFAQRPYRITKASPTWMAIQAKRPFVQFSTTRLATRASIRRSSERSSPS